MQQNWDTKSKAVDDNDSVSHQFQLENVIITLPIRKVSWKVSCWAEQEDDSCEYPEWTIEVGIGSDFVNELFFDGYKCKCNSFNDLLLTDFEILLIKLQTEEPHTSSLLLLLLTLGLLIWLRRSKFILLQFQIKILHVEKPQTFLVGFHYHC